MDTNFTRHRIVNRLLNKDDALFAEHKNYRSSKENLFSWNIPVTSIGVLTCDGKG